MTKKIIGSIGVVVGLALVTFFLYLFVFQNGDSRLPAPGPAEQSPVAARPVPKLPQKAASPAPGPAAPPETVTSSAPQGVPPLSEPTTSPGMATVPTPTPPPAEQKFSLQSPLEPKDVHGLLAGRYRSYKSAKKILEKIKQQKMPAFTRKEGKYYEVWAGPFTTPEEAEQAKKSLRVALKISPKKRKLEVPVPK